MAANTRVNRMHAREKACCRHSRHAHSATGYASAPSPMTLMFHASCHMCMCMWCFVCLHASSSRVHPSIFVSICRTSVRLSDACAKQWSMDIHPTCTLCSQSMHATNTLTQDMHACTQTRCCSRRIGPLHLPVGAHIRLKDRQTESETDRLLADSQTDRQTVFEA
jgi:hypothetical protein